MSFMVMCVEVVFTSRTSFRVKYGRRWRARGFRVKPWRRVFGFWVKQGRGVERAWIPGQVVMTIGKADGQVGWQGESG